MQRLKQIALITLLTLSFCSAAFAKTGTIVGGRTGTIVGGRTGTIVGGRTGTIVGGQTGILLPSSDQRSRANLQDELLSSLIMFLNTLW